MSNHFLCSYARKMRVGYYNLCKVCTGYTMYFNAKMNAELGTFPGRYKYHTARDHPYLNISSLPSFKPTQAANYPLFKFTPYFVGNKIYGMWLVNTKRQASLFSSHLAHPRKGNGFCLESKYRGSTSGTIIIRADFRPVFAKTLPISSGAAVLMWYTI